MTQNQNSTDHAMVSGSLWMIGMRWGVRVIGLVSTIILARLLTPEDFGVVAIALIVVHFFEYLSLVGVDLAIINDRNAGPDEYNAAWSLNVCIGIFLAALIFLSAPFAADFFGDARVEPVIQVLSLKAALHGFENIGTVQFRKSLNFRKDFLFTVYKKLITFVVLLTLVLIWQNYWGIVIAYVVAQFLEIVFSYFYHPLRPRFSFAAYRKIISFSQWVWVFNLGNYFKTKLDVLTVGRLNDTAALGDYHIASYVATTPADEIAQPLSRALMPVYSLINDNPAELIRAYLSILGILCQVIFPLCLGLMMVSHDFVLVLLGEKWLQAVPLVEVLVIASLFDALTVNSWTVLNGVGRPKANAIANVVHIGLLAPAVIYAGMSFGVVGIATARAIVTAVMVFVFLEMLRRYINLPVAGWFGVMIRPAIAVAGMVGFILLIDIDSEVHVALRMAAEIGGGALVYFGLSVLVWIYQGRPDGLEKLVWSRLGKRHGA